jgi:hypothetical protein
VCRSSIALSSTCKSANSSWPGSRPVVRGIFSAVTGTYALLVSHYTIRFINLDGLALYLLVGISAPILICPVSLYCNNSVTTEANDAPAVHQGSGGRLVNWVRMAISNYSSARGWPTLLWQQSVFPSPPAAVTTTTTNAETRLQSIAPSRPSPRSWSTHSRSLSLSLSPPLSHAYTLTHTNARTRTSAHIQEHACTSHSAAAPPVVRACDGFFLFYFFMFFFILLFFY